MNTRIAFGLVTSLAMVTACGGEESRTISTATTTGNGGNTTTSAQAGATSGQGGGSVQAGATSGQGGTGSGQAGATSGQGGGQGGSNGANALCPGLASEFAMEGQAYKDAFIDGCTKNPLCAGTGALVDKNDCSKTISTIKGLSADFKNVCENGSGQADPPSGTPNASCTPACTDLFNCAVSSN